jgi:uncharacterized DUF497 family protein
VDFRWNDWNEEHVANHGVLPADAEAVVQAARRPFPRKIDDDKWLVWGRSFGGRLLQVVFLVEDDDSIYVIHARPLSEREKRRYRRMVKI